MCKVLCWYWLCDGVLCLLSNLEIILMRAGWYANCIIHLCACLCLSVTVFLLLGTISLIEDLT